MTEMTVIIKDVNDIPTITSATAPGIIVKFLLDETNSRSMKVGLMSYGPGTKMLEQPHYHSVEELQLVINGHATLEDCNGFKYPLKSETIFLCPPGIEGAHGIENTSDFPMTLLFIYPRQDYETVKYAPATSDKRYQNKIFMRNIEDLKLEPRQLQFADVTYKKICDKSNAENLYAGIMWWNPGGKLTGLQPHYHSAEEFQFVLYGNATLSDCNGEKHPLREGVMFHCPPGIGGVHGIENTSDSPMSLLFVYPIQEPESTLYLTTQ